MRLNHIFYLLVVLLLVLCGLLLFYAGSDTKLFYCVEALVGLALVFLVIFYSRVLRPLRSIANGIDMLRGQDFSSRLIKVGQYEADLIIDVFNPMMEQLKNERLRLREQNTFLDLLLEASPMGVVATNMRGEVHMCDPSARAMLGCGPMGRMLAEIPGRLAARLAVMVPDSTETVRLNSADIYRCSRLKFMDKGCAHPFYLIETLTADVMAAEKEAYEKAIRMIVHEVNNTMGGVEATLDTMAMVCAGDDAVREVVDTTLDRTAQLRHFITRFAEAAKIPEPVPADTDVTGFVNANRNFLESLCTVHGVALRVDVSGVPLKAAIDVALMGQCLVNMVKNSVESIVSTGRQDGLVTIGIDGEKRTLTVCDNGAGITPEVEQRLFTPFYSTKRGGQGIGLIFISDILVRHGFRFSLFTDTGDSLTRFTIRL